MFCVGVEHVGGDMFVSIPKADAVFMKVHFINLTYPNTMFWPSSIR